jgi:hypothetical protein
LANPNAAEGLAIKKYFALLNPDPMNHLNPDQKPETKPNDCTLVKVNVKKWNCVNEEQAFFFSC